MLRRGHDRADDLARELIDAGAIPQASAILEQAVPAGQLKRLVLPDSTALADLNGIEVLDHVVIGRDEFFSFRERGYPLTG